jgi:hypothetical protein
MNIEERITARIKELLEYRAHLVKETLKCDAALGELQAILGDAKEPQSDAPADPTPDRDC